MSAFLQTVLRGLAEIERALPPETLLPDRRSRRRCRGGRANQDGRSDGARRGRGEPPPNRERLGPQLLHLGAAGQGAQRADELDRGEPRGPLHGIPIAVKDVIDVAGERATAASRILADNVAARDAATIAALRSAGAVIVGKLNTHEFAFGAMTTSSHFGPARNPWDLTRICGGSSGGSGRGSGTTRARNAGHGHREVDQDPRLLLRCHGHQANVGPRLEPRRGARLLQPRHGRTARAEREGLCDRAEAIASWDPADPTADARTALPGRTRSRHRRAQGRRRTSSSAVPTPGSALPCKQP